MTRLAVPIMTERTDQMRSLTQRAFAQGAELVELRLDALTRVTPADLQELLADRPGPVIVTCRPVSEGGHYAGSEQQRLGLLAAAGSAGADWIDCEYDAWSRLANVRQTIGAAGEVKGNGSGSRSNLICSIHDLQTTPDDLTTVVDRLLASGAQVVKLVTTARRITDSLRVLDQLRRVGSQRPMIALAMGEAGLLTRVLARKCAAWLTFASLEPGRESGPGQPDLQTLRNTYRWDTIDESTAVYGVVGSPVAQSLGPKLHNAAFASLGLNAVYLPLLVEPGGDALAAFVNGCLERGWLHLGGLSVTLPHKRNAFELPGVRLDPLAERIGAVNTLVVADGRLAGYNTDGLGAVEALTAALGGQPKALNGLAVALLGAGGTARAVLAALLDSGCRVTVYNRDRRRGDRLADAFGAASKPWDQRARHDGQVIVNATSVGMVPAVDETPMPIEGVRAGMVVLDSVYQPLRTHLLADAERQGCITVSGLEMFLRQAAEQLRLWTGQSLEADTLRRMLEGEGPG